MSIFIPINKPLWTPSYVLYAGGWSVLMLSLFIYFIDIKEKEKIFFPFKALGLNPLFAFAMAAIMAKTLGRILRWETMVLQDDGSMKEVTINAASWFYQNVCVALLGHNEWGSLLYALLYVSIFTGMAIFLYKKKIVIKL
jgi:predicted acyltransferase